MIRGEDGETLRNAIAKATAAGAELSARASSKSFTCAICQEEMIATSDAVRLPCGHSYHEDCLTKWLTKQHTCPTCRAALPERSAPTADNAAAAEPRFPDFGGPRGAAGPANPNMYT